MERQRQAGEINIDKEGKREINGKSHSFGDKSSKPLVFLLSSRFMILLIKFLQL